jgi:hypothetical protein
VTSHGGKLIATNYHARNPFSPGAAAIQSIFFKSGATMLGGVWELVSLYLVVLVILVIFNLV